MTAEQWENGPLPVRPNDIYRNVNPFVDLTDVEASPFLCLGEAIMGHNRVAFVSIDPTTLSKDPEMETMVTDLGDCVVGYLQVDDDTAEQDEHDDNPDVEHLLTRQLYTKDDLRDLLPDSTLTFLLGQGALAAADV